MVDVKLKIKTTEETEIDFDKASGLIEVESLSQSTGQPKEIFYGATASIGSAKILDVDGEVASLIQQEVIDIDKAKVQLSINGNTVRSHVITNSDYSPTNVFSVDFSNGIENLDNVKFGGYFNENRTTLYTIVFSAFSSIGYSGNFISSVIISNAVIESRLKSIAYTPAYLPAMSFKEFIDKVCKVAFLYFVEDKDGNMKFIDGIKALDVNSAIRIPSKYVYPTPQKDVILKNKKESVNWQDYIFGIRLNVPIYESTEEKTDGYVAGIGTTAQRLVGSIDTNSSGWAKSTHQEGEFPYTFAKIESETKHIEFTFTTNFDVRNVITPTVDNIRINGRKYANPTLVYNGGYPLNQNPLHNLIENINTSLLDYYRSRYVWVKSNEVIPEGTIVLSHNPETIGVSSFTTATGNRYYYSNAEVDSATRQIKTCYKGRDLSYKIRIIEGVPFETWTTNTDTHQYAASQENGVRLESSDEEQFNYLLAGGEIGGLDKPYTTNIQFTQIGTQEFRVIVDLQTALAKFRGTFTQTTTDDNPEVHWVKTLFSGSVEIVDEITITINGDEYVLNLQDSAKSVGDISSEKYYSIENNELIQENGSILANGQTKKIGEYVAETILEHYKDGVPTATVTVPYMDYYDTEDNLAISKDDGEVFSLNDIVVVEKDNMGTPRWTYADGSPMYWKVTGINIRKKGVVYIDLELQEIK